MTVQRFYLILAAIFLFLFTVTGEFLVCSFLYRFAKTSDTGSVYCVSGLVALAGCFLLFRKMMKNARQEGIPLAVVVVVYLLVSTIGCFFLRFSAQLVNGALDFAPAEVHMTDLTDKTISSFGGSIKDGMNPTAHLIYLKDENYTAQPYELLTTLAFYYQVDGGSRVEINLHKGLFGWPWIDAYQAISGQSNQ